MPYHHDPVISSEADAWQIQPHPKLEEDTSET
jgi:hypothetical protein